MEETAMPDGRNRRQVAPADVAPELIEPFPDDCRLSVDEPRLVTDGG